MCFAIFNLKICVFVHYYIRISSRLATLLLVHDIRKTQQRIRERNSQPESWNWNRSSTTRRASLCYLYLFTVLILARACAEFVSNTQIHLYSQSLFVCSRAADATHPLSTFGPSPTIITRLRDSSWTPACLSVAVLCLCCRASAWARV